MKYHKLIKTTALITVRVRHKSKIKKQNLTNEIK